MLYTKSRAVLIVILLFFSTASIAIPPRILATWDANSVAAGFHSSIPNPCIYSTVGAGNSWNSVNSTFSFNPDTAGYHARVSEQPQAFNYSHITIEDAATLPNFPDALMGTTVTTTPTSSGNAIVNADIYVLRSEIQNNNFHCASTTVPSGKYDWQSAILHELGHVVGFYHATTTEYRNCAMYQTIAAGETRRNLCTAEREEFIAAYGRHFIFRIPNVSGRAGSTVPINIYYTGTPAFPLHGELEVVQCGYETCTGGTDDFQQQASPLKSAFRCGASSTTRVQRIRYSLMATDGVMPDPVEFTLTCTGNSGASSGSLSTVPPATGAGTNSK